MKRIFILEDDPLRVQHFQERFADSELTFADSCTQVDRFQPPYDLVFLDHDLGGRQLEEHEDNGANFARAIKDRLGQAHVVVHSFNWDGSMNILAILPQAHKATFRSRTFDALLPALLGACQN